MCLGETAVSPRFILNLNLLLDENVRHRVVFSGPPVEAAGSVGFGDGDFGDDGVLSLVAGKTDSVSRGLLHGAQFTTISSLNKPISASARMRTALYSRSSGLPATSNA